MPLVPEEQAIATEQRLLNEPLYQQPAPAWSTSFAFHGEEGIPAEWRSQLALIGTIEELADRLHAAADGP